MIRKLFTSATAIAFLLVALSFTLIWAADDEALSGNDWCATDPFTNPDCEKTSVDVTGRHIHIVIQHGYFRTIIDGSIESLGISGIEQPLWEPNKGGGKPVPITGVITSDGKMIKVFWPDGSLVHKLFRRR